MTYVVYQSSGRSRSVTADFYNYWQDKPYVTFWRNVKGRDVPVATLRLDAATKIRPR